MTNYIFDFDDTIWSRDPNLIDVSIDNLFLLQRLAKNNKVTIISGNSIDHIKECYSRVNIIPDYDIWADSNSSLFKKFKKVKTLDEFKLNKLDVNTIKTFIPDYILCNITVNDCFIKIKPLPDILRVKICELLNNYFIKIDSNAEARATGKTSIDILSKNNDKVNILDHYFGDYFEFFGDEVDFGNDKNIALACDKVVKCTNVIDTNRRLRRLCDMD